MSFGLFFRDGFFFLFIEVINEILEINVVENLGFNGFLSLVEICGYLENEL